MGTPQEGMAGPANQQRPFLTSGKLNGRGRGMPASLGRSVACRTCDFDEHELNRSAHDACDVLHDEGQLVGGRSIEELHGGGGMVSVDLRVAQLVGSPDEWLHISWHDAKDGIAGQKLFRHCRCRAALPLPLEVPALDEEGLGADVKVDESILWKGPRASEYESAQGSLQSPVLLRGGACEQLVDLPHGIDMVVGEQQRRPGNAGCADVR